MKRILYLVLFVLAFWVNVEIAYAEDMGVISGDTTVEYLESTSVFIVPMDGYEITDIIVDGKSVGIITSYDFFDIESEHTVIARFKITDSHKEKLELMQEISNIDLDILNLDGGSVACTIFIDRNMKIIFDANSGSCQTESIDGIYGTAYGELPDAEKEDYIFKGWYTQATGGTKITSSSIINSYNDITLYAQYTQDDTPPIIQKNVEWSQSSSSYPQTGSVTNASCSGYVKDNESGLKCIIITLYRPNGSVIKTYNTTASGRWSVNISYQEAGCVDYVRCHVYAEDNAGNSSQANFYGGWIVY